MSRSGSVLKVVAAEARLATTLEKDYDLTQLRWTARATQAFFSALGRDGALIAEKPFGSPVLRSVICVLESPRGAQV